MRKLFLFLVIALAFSAPVLAQESTPEATGEAMMETEPWVCPEGFEGQALSVYNWSTYIAEDTVANFEEACGVTVTYDVYGSNEEMLARLSQGNPGYDIIVPTGYTVATMIGRELLEPLDHENIPNIANVTPGLLDPVYDPGNVYSVPYQWGTLGVGYNQTRTGEEITTWEQVFNYDGPVAWIDDPRFMLGLALAILGYDPNTANPDEITEAKDYLIEHGQNVVVIAADDGQAYLERGDVDIAIEYSGDIFQLAATCECEDYVYVLPEPTAQVWVDNLAIPLGAPNKALAEAFIDYILDPKVGADISNYTAYASPNQASIESGLLLPEYQNNPIIYPDEETLGRLFTTLDVPEAELDYNDAWDEIKISLGR